MYDKNLTNTCVVLLPGGFGRPKIIGETEPLVDVTTTDKEIQLVVEMPGN